MESLSPPFPVGREIGTGGTHTAPDQAQRVRFRYYSTGRAADVFDQGDGTVLRRYRSDHDTELEGRAMSWLRSEGLPVPIVHHAAATDIVMELVSGPTMMEDLGRRPWRVLGHARTLASLQRRINAIAAPGWFPRRPAVPSGNVVIHLDLHPMNVILAAEGPVIIDWTNATSGPASFDAATSFVLMSAFEVSGLRDRIGRRIMVEQFATARGRRQLQSSLHDACTYRLDDPNLTPGERIALEQIAKTARR